MDVFYPCILCLLGVMKIPGNIARLSWFKPIHIPPSSPSTHPTPQLELNSNHSNESFEAVFLNRSFENGAEDSPRGWWRGWRGWAEWWFKMKESSPPHGRINCELRRRRECDRSLLIISDGHLIGFDRV